MARQYKEAVVKVCVFGNGVRVRVLALPTYQHPLLPTTFNDNLNRMKDVAIDASS